MKLIIAIVMLSASFAYSQPKKMVIPATASSYPAYNGPSTSMNQITGSLGLTAGAINLGVTYIKPMADFGFGGYFFFQTSKDKNNVPVVNQVMALGGLINVNVVDNRSVRAYVAPGFGIAMLKDSYNLTSGKKSDETLIGPSFKIGAQLKTSGNFMIGLERQQFTNWLNDNVGGSTAEYYSAVGTFEF